MGLSNQNIAILILAAGASSRMGRTKQLLAWGNTTLLDHSINIAKATKTGRVMVVLGANVDSIIPEVSMEGVQYIINPGWKLGLGSSLALGVEFLMKNVPSLDGLLIMLCDQPLVDAEYLKGLIDQFKKGDKGIVATQYGISLGVPAIFGTKYFPDLLKLNADYGAKDLLEQYKNDVLSVNPQGKEVDVDTFEDYQKLIKGFYKG